MGMFGFRGLWTVGVADLAVVRAVGVVVGRGKEVEVVVKTRRGRVCGVVMLPFVRPTSVVLGLAVLVGCWYWVKAKLGWRAGAAV